MNGLTCDAQVVVLGQLPRGSRVCCERLPRLFIRRQPAEGGAVRAGGAAVAVPVQGGLKGFTSQDRGERGNRAVCPRTHTGQVVVCEAFTPACFYECLYRDVPRQPAYRVRMSTGRVTMCTWAAVWQAVSGASPAGAGATALGHGCRARKPCMPRARSATRQEPTTPGRCQLPPQRNQTSFCAPNDHRLSLNSVPNAVRNAPVIMTSWCWLSRSMRSAGSLSSFSGDRKMAKPAAVGCMRGCRPSQNR